MQTFLKIFCEEKCPNLKKVYLDISYMNHNTVVLLKKNPSVHTEVS